MTFELETDYEIYTDCTFKISTYTADEKTLALGVVDDCGYPVCILTVYLGEVPENYSFIDVNNCPFAEKLVKDLGIGEPTGINVISGYVSYPLYRFDRERLKAFERTERGELF